MPDCGLDIVCIPAALLSSLIHFLLLDNKAKNKYKKQGIDKLGQYIERIYDKTKRVIPSGEDRPMCPLAGSENGNRDSSQFARSRTQTYNFKKIISIAL